MVNSLVAYHDETKVMGWVSNIVVGTHLDRQTAAIALVSILQVVRKPQEVYSAMMSQWLST